MTEAALYGIAAALYVAAVVLVLRLFSDSDKDGQ
jgi:hypothetical protein